MALIITDHVKETSTTTGTDPLTLAGAMLGFQSFSAKCAVGDTVLYGIQAVDVQGGPSGDWECGIGTYSAANTLTRTTVTSSSNGGSAVSFSAGTKHVYITMPAVQVSWIREKLSANRTYYVSTTGSDSADGLTAATPFLTIQKAIDTVCDKIDSGPYQVTIQLADGTYTGGAKLKSYIGFLAPIIQGNAVTPASTFINASTTGDSAICNRITPSTSNFTSMEAYSSRSWFVQNLKLAGSRAGIEAVGPGNLIKFSNIEFGASAFHICATYGGVVLGAGPYKISGAASAAHIFATSGGETSVRDITVTLLASISTPYFVWASYMSRVLCPGNTYTMGGFTITGQRYLANQNSIIQTNGAGATYLPGTVAGAVSAGGIYA